MKSSIASSSEEREINIYNEATRLISREEILQLHKDEEDLFFRHVALIRRMREVTEIILKALGFDVAKCEFYVSSVDDPGENYAKIAATSEIIPLEFRVLNRIEGISREREDFVLEYNGKAYDFMKGFPVEFLWTEFENETPFKEMIENVETQLNQLKEISEELSKYKVKQQKERQRKRNVAVKKIREVLSKEELEIMGIKD